MSSHSALLPSNRKFGLFFSAVFFVLAGYFFWRQNIAGMGFSGCIGILFLLITLISPQSLGGLNRAWMTLGLTMGKLISPIVLGLMFFGLITPIALLSRLRGRDELRIRQKRALTYWRERTPRPDGQITSFKDQY